LPRQFYGWITAANSPQAPCADGLATARRQTRQPFSATALIAASAAKPASSAKGRELSGVKNPRKAASRLRQCHRIPRQYRHPRRALIRVPAHALCLAKQHGHFAIICCRKSRAATHRTRPATGRKGRAAWCPIGYAQRLWLPYRWLSGKSGPPTCRNAGRVYRRLSEGTVCFPYGIRPSKSLFLRIFQEMLDKQTALCYNV